MNGALKTFLKIGNQIAEQMVPGVAQVEAIAQAIPGLKGKDKATAVVNAALGGVNLAETELGVSFAEEPEFQAAVREINDGFVHLLHAIQAKHAAAATGGAPGESTGGTPIGS